MDVELYMVSYVIGDRQSLLDALAQLGSNDSDFSGENGPEFLWCRTWQANGYEDHDDYVIRDGNYDELKYKSNLDFILEKCADESTDEQNTIYKFLSAWMDHDTYFVAWDMDYIIADSKAYISMAYCH